MHPSISNASTIVAWQGKLSFGPTKRAALKEFAAELGADLEQIMGRRKIAVDSLLQIRRQAGVVGLGHDQAQASLKVC